MTSTSSRVHPLLLATVLAVVQTATVKAQVAPADRAAPDAGQHAFDFEFGSWTVELSRLQEPLTGSQEWVDYTGTSVVHRVWEGRANLGELEVEGPAGRILGLSMRIYDPSARQWRIHWANSRDGQLGPAMIGQFRDGRGEFYNQEIFQGRAVLVRFIFSDITEHSFRLEQAFSADGGATWEPNWVARFRRVEDEPANNRPRY